MKTSDTVAALAAALAKAQGSMATAVRDGVNDHYGNSYASLGSLLKAAKASLSSAGLAVVQASETLHVDDGILAIVVTRLLHSSGEWMETEVSIPLDQLSAQGLGKALTYLRRYSLASMVGIVSDEDDDGEADADTRTPQPKAPASRESAVKAPRKRRAAAPADEHVPDGERRDVEGILADVRVTPAGKGNRTAILIEGFGWCSTFRDEVSNWLRDRKGRDVRVTVVRSGQFWNLEDAVELTASGGEVAPEEDIPF